MKNAWIQYDNDQIQKVFLFNEGYMNWITKAKTERLFVQDAIALAKQKGYQRSDALAAWSLVANLHYSLLIARKRSERACAAAHYSFSMTLSSLRLSIQ